MMRIIQVFLRYQSVDEFRFPKETAQMIAEEFEANRPDLST
jgi:hypothetical protein